MRIKFPNRTIIRNINKAINNNIYNSQNYCDMKLPEIKHKEPVKEKPKKYIYDAIKNMFTTFSMGKKEIVNKAPELNILRHNSNELKKAIFCKPQEHINSDETINAYKFNPWGTQSDILASNPYVQVTPEGKYFLPNKKAAQKGDFIDLNKDQVIVIRQKDNEKTFEVNDLATFKKKYIDAYSFKRLNRYVPIKNSQLKHNKLINVVTNDKTSFIQAPVGTKVETAKGIQTVKQDEIVVSDALGNLSIQKTEDYLWHNVPLSNDGQSIKGYELLKLSHLFGFKIEPKMYDTAKIKAFMLDVHIPEMTAPQHLKKSIYIGKTIVSKYYENNFNLSKDFFDELAKDLTSKNKNTDILKLTEIRGAVSLINLLCEDRKMTKIIVKAFQDSKIGKTMEP